MISLSLMLIQYFFRDKSSLCEHLFIFLTSKDVYNKYNYLFRKTLPFKQFVGVFYSLNNVLPFNKEAIMF